MTSFEICKDHADIDVDEWASIECPLQEGVHCVTEVGNREIFDSPQWVVVVNKEGKWLASLADDEGHAFDIFLARNGQEGNLEDLETNSEGNLFLNLL